MGHARDTRSPRPSAEARYVRPSPPRRICQVLQRMCRGPLDPETKKQHRMAVSVLMRMLVSLTDHKKWAFVHPSKQRSEYTAQEERLVAFLSQTCTTSCLTLLQHLQVGTQGLGRCSAAEGPGRGRVRTCGAGQRCIGRRGGGGGYPLPPAPGRPAYAQPLSP